MEIVRLEASNAFCATRWQFTILNETYDVVPSIAPGPQGIISAAWDERQNRIVYAGPETDEAWIRSIIPHGQAVGG